MRSARVLVAVVAVLCIAAVSGAAVIDVSVQGSNWGKTGPGASYQNGLMGNAPGPQKYFVANYDISSYLSDLTAPGVTYTAKLIYNDAEVPSAAFTTRVAELAVDFKLITTPYVYPQTAVVDNSGGTTNYLGLLGVNICTADGVSTAGSYLGLQSVDITPIIQSWVSGVTNYGLGVSCSVNQNVSGNNNVIKPYIEITTVPAPEPATMGLLAVGGIATLLRRRKA